MPPKLTNFASTSKLIAMMFVASLVSTSTLSGQVSPDDPSDTAELIQVIQSDAPAFDIAMACRRLAAIGDESAVAGLQALLGDQQLDTYARSALEAIPGDAASKALRDALQNLSGDQAIGVIGSLGRRRDAQAIDLLASYMNPEQGATTIAAARALADIGTADSFAAINRFAGSGADEVPLAVAWAQLECVEAIVRNSDRDEAARWYAVLTESRLPAPVKLASEQRAIVLLQEAGLERLKTLLTADDETEFQAGVFVARQLGAKAAATLVSLFDEAPLDRQPLLINALGNLPVTEVLPVVWKATASPSADVRREAYAALGKQNAPEASSGLLAGMADQDPEVAATARQAAIELPGRAIDLAIVEILDERQAALLPAAIEIAKQRQISAATPGLFMLVDAKEIEIGRAAMTALGATIDVKELPRIIERIKESTNERRAAAITALNIACARLPREACGQMIAESLADAKRQDQISLLEQLAAIGGESALQTVAALAAGDDDNLKDTATRLLGTWPTSDVAPVLDGLLDTLSEDKYKTRVLRGYLRVARQLEMSTDERIEVCRRAAPLAVRRPERQLVLDVLQRFPTPGGITVASQWISSDVLGAESFEAALKIAEASLVQKPDELAQALQSTLKQELSDPQQQQVTALLTQAVKLGQEKEAETGFVPLFDGKSLDGWHGNQAIFKVVDGQIVGGNLQDQVERNEFLRTDKTYGDFELRLQFKLLGDSPNAGVQIRTKEIPDHHEVSGYQADLGPGWWGCLYDESRRNRVLAGPPAEKRGEPIRENEWNDYRILCEGPRIRLWVNGVPTVDYTEEDESIPLKGIIAVQVHAGAPMEARYRNLRIREID